MYLDSEYGWRESAIQCVGLCWTNSLLQYTSGKYSEICLN